MDQIVTNIKNDLDMTYSVRRALSFPDLSTGGRSDIHNKYTKRGKMYKRKSIRNAVKCINVSIRNAVKCINVSIRNVKIIS